MGPIIVVEDDVEDQEILIEVFDSLGITSEIKFFKEGSDVIAYLKTTTDRPFLILTDVNIPGMDGIQLRMEILRDEFLRRKSIPYIYLSTSDGKQIIQQVYEMQVQGYFQKENSFEGIKKQLALIIDYWKVCKHPNLF